MEKNTLGKDRFQFQPWYVKLWRRRWLLLVPFEAVMIWAANLKDSDLDFKACWSIAHGMAHIPSRMNWVFSWDEVQYRMDEAFKRSEFDPMSTDELVCTFDDDEKEDA